MCNLGKYDRISLTKLQRQSLCQYFNKELGAASQTAGPASIRGVSQLYQLLGIALCNANNGDKARNSATPLFAYFPYHLSSAGVLLGNEYPW